MSFIEKELNGFPTILEAKLSTEIFDGPGDLHDRVIWRALESWLLKALEHVNGNDGVVVSYGHDHIRALFEFDASAAVSTAVALHHSAFFDRNNDVPPFDLRVGIARGDTQLRLFEAKKNPPNGMVAAVLGGAPWRANQLAELAPARALLIDAAVLDDISLRYVSSPVGRARGWRGADYLGPVREVRRRPMSTPLVFYELKWSGEELMNAATRDDVSNERGAGVLSRWNGPDRASIQAEDGEILWMTASHVVGESKPESGQRVWFVPAPPEPPGDTRTATAVLVANSEATGELVKVFEDRRYAFLRVTDGTGASQDVFLHADDNQWPLQVGDRVRFRVGENIRGVAAVGAERVAGADVAASQS